MDRRLAFLALFASVLMGVSSAVAASGLYGGSVQPDWWLAGLGSAVLLFGAVVTTRGRLW